MLNYILIQGESLKNVKIEKTIDYILYGPIGSRNSIITICKEQDKIMTGCFCGSKNEFLKAVDRTHKDNNYAKDYKKLIDFIFEK